MRLLPRRLLRPGPLGAALTTAQIAWLMRQQWQSIPGEDRGRLQGLLRKSRGKPSNLSRDERRELMRLVRTLEVPRVVRQGLFDGAALKRQLRR